MSEFSSKQLEVLHELEQLRLVAELSGHTDKAHELKAVIMFQRGEFNRKNCRALNVQLRKIYDDGLALDEHIESIKKRYGVKKDEQEKNDTVRSDAGALGIDGENKTGRAS